MAHRLKNLQRKVNKLLLLVRKVIILDKVYSNKQKITKIVFC